MQTYPMLRTTLDALRIILVVSNSARTKCTFTTLEPRMAMTAALEQSEVSFYDKPVSPTQPANLDALTAPPPRPPPNHP